MRSLAKVAIHVLTEVRHGGSGCYRQRGRWIQGCYIQWALYFHFVSMFTTYVFAPPLHFFIRPLLYSKVWVYCLQMYVNMPGPVKDCVPSCAALTPSVTSLLSPRVERARTLCLRHQPPSPKKTSNSTTLILSRQKNKMQRTKTKVEMKNQVLALGCPELKK